MQTYNVTLESPVSSSYRAKRAADSLDIDAKKKSIHSFSVKADLETPFSVGLILGASGSGKTTLAKKIYGEDCFKVSLDPEKPVIEQFPPEFEYERCAKLLSGVGLTQVPCWIRPVKTLSNGQQARAEAALLLCKEDLGVVDEWTSVVDRTVAKVMSHCIQKHARAEGKSIVLLSCHYDVVDWLNPDWVIDCNKQTFENRRLLWRSFERKEKLKFDIRKVDRETWPYFSKYHYLSDRLAPSVAFFGLFHEENQVGFVAFSNYVPTKKGNKMILHYNRLVIHPDYAGAGLGILFANKTAEIMALNYRILVKFSSAPMFKSHSKDKNWRLLKIERAFGETKQKKQMKRKTGFRENIKTYTFEYVGE